MSIKQNEMVRRGIVIGSLSLFVSFALIAAGVAVYTGGKAPVSTGGETGSGTAPRGIIVTGGTGDTDGETTGLPESESETAPETGEETEPDTETLPGTEPVTDPVTDPVTEPVTETDLPETNPPETQPPETQPPETQPPETQPPETQPPETLPPETQPPETQPPETQPPETYPIWTYDYSQPVPLTDEVGKAYFDRVAMIGDSMTYGLLMKYRYTTFSGVTPLCQVGASGAKVIGGTEVFLSGYDGLMPDWSSSRKYAGEKIVNYFDDLGDPGAIYLFYGANDAFQPVNSFISAYRQMIARLRRLYPSAAIYVTSVFPFGKSYAEDPSWGGLFGGNAKVVQMNGALQQMCFEEKVYYLDVYSVLVNESGDLRAEYSVGDGIHLSDAGKTVWKEYLCCHAVN